MRDFKHSYCTHYHCASKVVMWVRLVLLDLSEYEIYPDLLLSLSQLVLNISEVDDEVCFINKVYENFTKNMLVCKKRYSHMKHQCNICQVIQIFKNGSLNHIPNRSLVRYIIILLATFISQPYAMISAQSKSLKTRINRIVFI